MPSVNRRVLPGFSLSLGYTVFYLTVLVLLPILACFSRAASLTLGQFGAAVWTERTRAAYLLTFGTSFVAAVVNVFLGLLIAWVLVRYRFPGRRLMDSLIDLPLALPTAVGGLVYASLYVKKGWLGRYLVPLGIQAAYSRLAIVLVLVFIGLPFVVRTVQPVLEDLEAESEEAAASLGATRWQAFRRVIRGPPGHLLLDAGADQPDRAMEQGERSPCLTPPSRRAGRSRRTGFGTRSRIRPGSAGA